MNRADATSRTVFLFDVDNTLIDNDRVTADLQRHLQTQSQRRSCRPLLANLEQLFFYFEKAAVTAPEPSSATASSVPATPSSSKSPIS